MKRKCDLAQAWRTNMASRCLNSPGTIDADYRGDVGVILINHGDSDFVVQSGDRIAQLVVAQYASFTWDAVTDLSDTARGEGGFGHTGK